jgi:hypothetical protein
MGLPQVTVKQIVLEEQIEMAAKKRKRRKKTEFLQDRPGHGSQICVI